MAGRWQVLADYRRWLQLGAAWLLQVHTFFPGLAWACTRPAIFFACDPSAAGDFFFHVPADWFPDRLPAWPGSTPKRIALPAVCYLFSPADRGTDRTTPPGGRAVPEFVGLFKKVLIADKLAEWSTVTFDLVAAGQPIAMADAWGGTLAYTFQLYFDFSGYSDMALGLAALFGIRLPRNFDSPYQAKSIGELWNRWHITLSHFLRDYLFLPLGGSHRRRPVMTSRNLLMTMTLCGCWHGAGWTFLLFGALQGLLMSLHHYWRLHLRSRFAWRLPGFLAWSLTFGSFAMTLVLFRASTLATAGRIAIRPPILVSQKNHSG